MSAVPEQEGEEEVSPRKVSTLLSFGKLNSSGKESEKNSGRESKDED